MKPIFMEIGLFLCFFTFWLGGMPVLLACPAGGIIIAQLTCPICLYWDYVSGIPIVFKEIG
jgi:hypothetical protein